MDLIAVSRSAEVFFYQRGDIEILAGRAASGRDLKVISNRWRARIFSPTRYFGLLALAIIEPCQKNLWTNSKTWQAADGLPQLRKHSTGLFQFADLAQV
ncbi:MAG: hypothetical protein MK160_06490 [Rhodobacteraceae bacterium]|nr:hypothetical protein [Paracoccaceae bacterium]